MKTRIMFAIGILSICGIALIGNSLVKAQESQTTEVPPAVAPAETAPAPASGETPLAPAKGETPLTPIEATPPAVAPAETTPAPAANAGVETVQLPTGASEIKGATATTNALNKDMISIALDDVEMADVVRMFTRISGANIIADPSNMIGRVTVNLVDVEWKPALDSILDMHSLALVEKTPGSGVYSIVQKTPGAPPPMLVETIFLKYASVSNVVPVVSAMIADYKGTVSAFASRNALVVRTTASNLGEIKQVILNIDKLRDQVFIEAKFMELTDEAIKDLGIDWQVLSAYTIGAGSLQWQYGETRSWDQSKVDKQSEWDKRNNVDTLTRKYDPTGVQKDEYFHTTTIDPTTRITTETYTPAENIVDTIDQGKNITSDITDSFTKNISDMRTAVLGAADFQLILSALKQMNGVSIVSNPKIIVANEQTATIHIGQRERPFISSVTPGQQGQASVKTYNPGEAVDYGVKLMVTPTVNTMSNITVKIDPELTRLVKYSTAPDGQTYPITATKKISTVFCLENGKTVAIGGLTETTEREAETKIPLLGDIPIIGKYLFTHSHTEKKQEETIIFVTVGLATPEGMENEVGVPENTDLVRKRLVLDSLKNKKRGEDLKKLKETAESDSVADAKTKERLLKRTK